MSVRAGAVGRGLVQEGHPELNSTAISEYMEVGRQGECFREQRPEIGVYDGTDHGEKLE